MKQNVDVCYLNKTLLKTKYGITSINNSVSYVKFAIKLFASTDKVNLITGNTCSENT